MSILALESTRYIPVIASYDWSFKKKTFPLGTHGVCIAPWTMIDAISCTYFSRTMLSHHDAGSLQQLLRPSAGSLKVQPCPWQMMPHQVNHSIGAWSLRIPRLSQGRFCLPSWCAILSLALWLFWRKKPNGQLLHSLEATPVTPVPLDVTPFSDWFCLRLIVDPS